MSKKITLTDDQILQVEALSAYLSIEQIADYFGFSGMTFHEIKKRQPEVLLAYKKGKAKAIGKVARKLTTLIEEGDVTAIIFYLKTQGGWSTESKSNNIIKISFGNKSALEIINSTLTALEDSQISLPEAQQLSALALAKINIEKYNKEDKTEYGQQSIEEALALVNKIDKAMQNLDELEKNTKK